MRSTQAHKSYFKWFCKAFASHQRIPIQQFDEIRIMILLDVYTFVHHAIELISKTTERHIWLVVWM